MAWYDELEYEKARHEAAVIVRAFAERGIDIGGAASPGGGVAFMYAKDQFLAREQYLGEVGVAPGGQDIQDAHRRRSVLDVLRENGVQNVEVRRVVRDVVVVRLHPDREEREERDARFLLERINEEFGGRIATLDHVVTTAQGHPTNCPATEPQEVYDPKPYPPVCPGRGGDGVRIYVADTGIVKATVNGTNCPWLAGVDGDDDPSIAGSTILHEGGHGTFVAGVIRCMAPGAEIMVADVFAIAGSALESDFVPRLNEGFAYGAEIFQVTVASPTMDNLPLMAFEAWMEDLHQHKGVVCVVPAGNDDSREPYWPAAFPGMISVGALSTDWRSRAYFSNHGGWVDVYAPGQNLVNAFATGSYTCEVTPFAGEVRTFTDMAQWSGTSFSTPIVTGLIAARMARCGESGEEAAAALLAKARAHAIPGVGPVLQPCCDDDDDQRHGGRCGHGCGCGGHDCGCGGHGCDRGGCGCGGHGKHGPRPR